MKRKSVVFIGVILLTAIAGYTNTKTEYEITKEAVAEVISYSAEPDMPDPRAVFNGKTYHKSETPCKYVIFSPEEKQYNLYKTACKNHGFIDTKYDTQNKIRKEFGARYINNEAWIQLDWDLSEDVLYIYFHKDSQ